jgi:phage protein D
MDMQNRQNIEISAPAFQVVIGNILDSQKLWRAITHISVNQVISDPCSFSISISDPDFSLIDGLCPIIAEGKNLEINMGYAGKMKKMIEGEISALSAELDDGGGLTIQAEGFDVLHNVSRGTKKRTLKEGNDDSQIVHDIATDMHYSASVDQTVKRPQARYQNHVSDLHFLRDLAESNGFCFWVDSDKKQLCFKRRRESSQVNVDRGRNLISFSARLSTAGQVQIVEVIGYAPFSRELISATASIDQVSDFQGNIDKDGLSQIKGSATNPSKRVIYAESGIGSSEAAKKRAEAELIRLRKDLFTASGSCIGNPDIQPGSVITVTGMGNRFSKNYVVKSARHDISQSGYVTSFELELFS